MVPNDSLPPSPTGGGPDVSPNNSDPAARNPSRSPPAAGGPPLNSTQSPAISGGHRLPPTPPISMDTRTPKPSPSTARTLTAAKRRRMRWTILAALTYIAYICTLLARDGHVSMSATLLTLFSLAYFVILFLLLCSSPVPLIELGEFVGILAAILNANTAKLGWDIVLINLLFVNMMAMFNAAVIFVKDFDLANIGLSVFASVLLFAAKMHDKSWVPFIAVSVTFYMHWTCSVELAQDFMANIKVPEFPEALLASFGVAAGVRGMTRGLHEPLLRPQQESSGGRAPHEAPGGTRVPDFPEALLTALGVAGGVRGTTRHQIGFSQFEHPVALTVEAQAKHVGQLKGGLSKNLFLKLNLPTPQRKLIEFCILLVGKFRIFVFMIFFCVFQFFFR
ncbi:prolyl-tRNA synthetase associated domain-containing protein 1 [Striga asiatica]|uniref:Prolyl-tRNA synthetase associated domain-containing protein 1 n=1 Tax=Striga asiatica TaxID=4170 RepID=A0A5A7PYX2_STRAF|nr:prolyl-tRNA synthetase associated domain-containing protein 1 [Striga asiatica]